MTTKQTVNVMGMVRDILVDFDLAHTGIEAPSVWGDAKDMKSGRKIVVDKIEAAEMASYIVKAREWASVAGVFKDSQRKSNVMRHSSRIAQQLADIAGVDMTIPTSTRKKVDENGEQVRPQLPTEIVDDLETGDLITVVRHVTRWGLDKIDTFPARVKGRAVNGDYWVTSLDDMTCRACRPNEVIITSRARLAVAS